LGGQGVGERRAAGVRLQAVGVAARAVDGGLGQDPDVADVARGAPAAVQPSVHDDAASDAGAELDDHEVCTGKSFHRS
jgi:hypothetical protein